MHDNVKFMIAKCYDKDGNFLFDIKTLPDTNGRYPSLEKEKANESEKETSRD